MTEGKYVKEDTSTRLLLWKALFVSLETNCHLLLLLVLLVLIFLDLQNLLSYWTQEPTEVPEYWCSGVTEYLGFLNLDPMGLPVHGWPKAI